MNKNQNSNDTNGRSLFCRKCGNKLLPDSLFCDRCGTKILEDVSNKNITYNESTRNDNKKNIIIVIIISILVGVIATLFLTMGLRFLTKQDDEQYENTKTTSNSVSHVERDEDKQKSVSSKSENTKINQNTKSLCSSPGCDNPKKGTGSYCAEHTCIESFCSSQTDFNSNYCFFHKCRESGCRNGKGNYGFYCVEHTCIEGSCSNQKSFASSYCSMHECMYGGCHNGRSGYGFYCSQHKCAKSGCNSQKAVMSNYCLMHDN